MKQVGTFEKYIGDQARRSWNSSIDGIHARLLRAPETAQTIADDAVAIARQATGYESTAKDAGNAKS
jgi:hypothetical protein